MAHSARMPRSGEAPPIPSAIEELRSRHSVQRKQLTLFMQPARTLKYFFLAVCEKILRLSVYAAGHKFTFVFFLATCSLLALLLGHNDKLLQESWSYASFALWWTGLGVASSIGLGSGLHTFVMYLGPHIAMFTMKAALCGREDLKLAPYDTPQWRVSSSWADRDCESFGAPKYPRVSLEHEQYMVPSFSVLLQVLPEVILWGIGTALGELPPYFVSRAASLSGEQLNEIEQTSSDDNSVLQRAKQWMTNQVKRWHFGFFGILSFAAIPNPLFDLAGIMCGQFLVPFWKFFLATLIGKALIKAQFQSFFIILVMNPHFIELLLEFLGRKVPMFQLVLPRIMRSLQRAQDDLRHHTPQTKQSNDVIAWLASVWNAMVVILILGFFMSIVTSTAQNFLHDRQLREVAELEKTVSSNGDMNGSSEAAQQH